MHISSIEVLQKKMNRLLTFIVIVLSSCQSNQVVYTVANGTHISNVSIITTEDGSYHPYIGHVLTDGPRIVYVGKEEPVVEGTCDNIDGTGKFLIPGLIDSHTHITEVQGMLPHHTEAHPELAAAFKKQMPRSYLYHGFTTLINLGWISDEQIAFMDHQAFAPDLYHTGYSGASVANGYPMNFIPEEVRFEVAPNFIYMESEAENIPKKFDPANHTPEAVVARIKESQGIAVKSYYEYGFGNMPKLPVPTKQIMTDLLETAHAQGLVLTVHGNSLEAHAFLGEIGVDVIAHGLWNWEKYKGTPLDSLPEEIKNVLDLQISKGIGYTPTLTVLAGEEVLADDNFLKDPELKKVTPSDLLEWYQTEEGQWFARDLFGNLEREEVHKIYGNIQAHAMLALKYLSENGGLILFGTDTPSAPTYGNQPGHNGYWELKLMKQAGVPLATILASATINNARAFKLDSIGSLKVGKRANMILLDRNPLEEIEAYNSIDKVFLAGEVIDRKSLAVK